MGDPIVIILPGTLVDPAPCEETYGLNYHETNSWDNGDGTISVECTPFY
jgi:hypothetical protein